jgi:hypothetical protein
MKNVTGVLFDTNTKEIKNVNFNGKYWGIHEHLGENVEAVDWFHATIDGVKHLVYREFESESKNAVQIGNQIIRGNVFIVGDVKEDANDHNPEHYSHMFKIGLLKDEVSFCSWDNEEDEEDEVVEKKMVNKGFLSQKGKPTHNALMMYFIYLSNRPNGWNEEKGRCESAINEVRKYFGTDYGFECMITWGIQFGCKNSKTSDGRHHAMSLAYHDALGMVGQGYVFTTKKP